MSRQYKMTDKLRSVLADKQYKDPRLFTTTVYDENGKLIPEPDQEKMTEEQYFSQFIPPDQARDLVKRLRQVEALDRQQPLTEREREPEHRNSLSPGDRRGRLDDGDSEWVDQYDWKTRRPSTD